MDDDLRMRFDLARQSIASWSADTVRLVAAASESRQTGRYDQTQLDAAERMIAAVREERQSLASAGTPVSDDLVRGMEVALNELELLERDIGAALSDLRHPATSV